MSIAIVVGVAAVFVILFFIGLILLCIFWKRVRAQFSNKNRPSAPSPIRELYPSVAPLVNYRAESSAALQDARQPLMSGALSDPSVVESVLSNPPPQVYAPSPLPFAQVPTMSPSDAAKPPLPFAPSPPPFNNMPPPPVSSGALPVGVLPPPPPFLSAVQPPPFASPTMQLLPPPAYTSPSVTLVDEKQMPMSPVAPPPPQPIYQPPVQPPQPIYQPLLQPPLPIHQIAAAPQMYRPPLSQRPSIAMSPVPYPQPLPQGAPLPNPTRILGRRDMSEMHGGAPVQFRPTRQYHRYRASLDADDFDYQADLDAYFARHHNRANWHPEPAPQPADNPSASEAESAAGRNQSPLQQRAQQPAAGAAGASPQKTEPHNFRILKRTSFRASMENQEPIDENSVLLRRTLDTSPNSTVREPIYENWPIRRNSERQVVTGTMYRQILSTSPEEDDEVFPTHVYENWPPPPDVAFELDRTDGRGAVRSRGSSGGGGDQNDGPPPVPRRDPRLSRPRPFSNAAGSRQTARARSLSPRRRPAQTLPPLDTDALPVLPRKVIPRTPAPATPRSRAAHEFTFTRSSGKPSVSSGSRRQQQQQSGGGAEPELQLLHTFSSDSDVHGAVSRHLQLALARARELENAMRRRQPLPATPHLNEESLTAREPPPLPLPRRASYKMASLQRPSPAAASAARPAGATHSRNVAALRDEFLRRSYRQSQPSSHRSNERKRYSADAHMIIQRAMDYMMDSALHPAGQTEAKNSVEHFRPKAKRSAAAEAFDRGGVGSPSSSQRRRTNSEPREAGALSIAQDDTGFLLHADADAATDEDFEPPPPHTAGGHRSRDRSSREASSGGGFRYAALHSSSASAGAHQHSQQAAPHQSPPKAPKSFKFFAHAL